MGRSVTIGLTVAFIALVGIIVFLVRGSTRLTLSKVLLKKALLKDYPQFLEIEKLKGIPAEFLSASYVEPTIDKTSLRNAGILSVYMVSAYSELCRDEAPLRKTFLDNLCADKAEKSKWLGYSAAQLKEASKNASGILNKKKRPKLEELSKREIVDLTICLFFAALERISKEYAKEVKKKEEKDGLDIFSGFQQAINTSNAENTIKSMHIIAYSLKLGLNLDTEYYHLVEDARKSEVDGLYKKYKDYAQSTYYSEFTPTVSTDHKMYVFHDLSKEKAYGIVV